MNKQKAIAKFIFQLSCFFIIYYLFLSIASAAQIKIAWDPNTESDLAGYKVYYGTSSGNYGTPINVGNVTTYTISDLTAGQTYYIAVTAYDTYNNESDYSNEVSGPATEITQTYTVTTNPSGLQVVVDGITYTAPQTFNWATGSIHTISVSTPQYGESGTRYAFSYWNDGGSRTHNITASSRTTYIAYFTTQFSLTTSISPSGAGTVNPSGTNWYNSGRSVTISATANSGHAFSGWSGDLTGSVNPATVTMDRPKSITAQFTTTSEVISTPAIPSGPTTGQIGISYTYIASGASSNLGHSLQYQFDWKGDSSDLSSWGVANQQKVWDYAGTYNVRVRARCATHTSVISDWSAALQVTIQGDYQVSCGDGGIPCIERVDGGDDSNNLVNGKPKGDVEFEFKIKVYDAGGSPQYVRLLTTQRTNPIAEDFYSYDMTCSGQFPAGAECRYKTILGPAAIHKFYFEVMMSNGTVIRYPSSGYITGPEIHLLNGNNLVGVPRNIINAQLNGQEAFGSTKVYRWNGELNAYTEVSHSEPVKLGEGYSLYRQNDNLLELNEYVDYQNLEFVYPLETGFNLISNPYNGNVNLSDMKIKKGNNAPISWLEAVARGWIVDALYYFNGRDWGNTYSYKTSQNGAVMVPWIGYWLILNVSDDNYYLIVTRP
ncbi:MAG: InlB B-repeat-containing protein [Thermodesulfobacteriota bacterium]